jgi:hypothetical protein
VLDQSFSGSAGCWEKNSWFGVFFWSRNPWKKLINRKGSHYVTLFTFSLCEIIPEKSKKCYFAYLKKHLLSVLFQKTCKTWTMCHRLRLSDQSLWKKCLRLSLTSRRWSSATWTSISEIWSRRILRYVSKSFVNTLSFLFDTMRSLFAKDIPTDCRSVSTTGPRFCFASTDS